MKKSTIFVIVAVLCVLMFLSTSVVIFKLGVFAQPTKIELSSTTDEVGCAGELGVLATVVDVNGYRVPYAPIQISIDGGPGVILISDQNGQLKMNEPLQPEWCGKEIYVEAKFAGDDYHQSSNAGVSSIVRKPTTLYLDLPAEAMEGDDVEIRATLSDSNTQKPLSGKTISVRNVSGSTDGSGVATFRLRIDRVGAYRFEAVFAGDERYEPARSGSEYILAERATCADGTRTGSCNGAYMCLANKTLQFNCGTCGCPTGLVCSGNECIREETRIVRLIDDLQKSVVMITSDENQGSGVIIAVNDHETAILTNRHVVDPDQMYVLARGLTVKNVDNVSVRPTRVAIAPNGIDMALISVPGRLGPVASTRNTSISRGETILALGSPLGIRNSVSKGIISNLVETNASETYSYQAIQIDAAVNPGSSGGGVFLASDGTLIGITSFKLFMSAGSSVLAEGIGFAIPLNPLQDFGPGEWRVLTPS